MRNTVSPLHGANLSISAFLKQPQQWKQTVLGALCFSANPHESQMRSDMEIPCMHVPMQRLDAGDSICEVWHSNSHLTEGQNGAIRYRHDDAVLFGVIELSESMFAKSI
ncbi:MAG: hypothetical protein ABIT70_07005, partial [Sulfuriferula sp.]